jgi:hypothetical protein
MLVFQAVQKWLGRKVRDRLGKTVMLFQDVKQICKNVLISFSKFACLFALKKTLEPLN